VLPGTQEVTVIKDGHTSDTIPDYPASVCATSMLARLVDGLAFRFRWATEGLNEEEVVLRPSVGSRSLAEIAGHIWGLVNWVNISVSGAKSTKPRQFSLLRKKVLDMLAMLRNTLSSMDDGRLSNVRIDDQPFWHMINGPISDALTHVGQITAFRRLAGDPAPKAKLFLGLPPEEAR
jgi:hypothetical protein